MIALSLKAAAFGLVAFSGADANVPSTLHLAQTQKAPSLPVTALGSDYKVMSNGCTYRKTQAPGYEPRWILIVNPQALGQQLPTGKCKGML